VFYGIYSKIAETAGEDCRTALWHYKMSPFGTSRFGAAGT
jgi:hypothetical protein